MLRSIHTVTYTVPSFDASCHALTDAFDYRRIDSGRIGTELACLWGAPACADSRYSTFAPDSGETVHIRFIEQPPTVGYIALKTFGWNAAELHVEDVREIAASLNDTPFEILGGPRDLLNDGSAIALQVRGPSDEIFYLTEINGESMQRDYGKAESRVGRPFIVVLGCADHEKSLGFYSRFCQAVTEAHDFPIHVLAAAHGLNPVEARFPIASAILQEQYRIELDGYPDSAAPRPVDEGWLPPGLCLVTFLVDSLDAIPVETVRIPPGLVSGVHDARETALIRGPDGELLELAAVAA